MIFAQRPSFLALVVLLVGLATGLQADPYAPGNYYDGLSLNGATLKSELNDLIDGHTVRSYNDARSILQVTDVDPNDPDRMILIYNRESLDVSAINPNGGIPGWDSGVSWNREHTWPRSLGVGSSGADNSDLHNLRPSRNNINSQRGNLNFGGEYGEQGYGPLSDGGTVWYPGDEDAGMVARQMFYMDTRYEGGPGDGSSTTDLSLVNNTPGTGGTTLGRLSRLIEWHYEAVPDEFERRRNQVIYDDYQHNRNPFIDHPEWVWAAIINQTNDSQLAIAGGVSGGAGATSLDVDLGRAFVGGAGPGTQSVTLNKSGDDGVYYEVATSGDATSSVSGRLNAFGLGGSGSRSIEVGLDVSTAVAGHYAGEVTIDNLDITTGAGAGRGAQDGDDVIDVGFTVLEHAVASFDSSDLIEELTIDFGEVSFGSTPLLEMFDLVNFMGAGGPGFAADLDFDSVLGVGDTLAFDTDLAAFTGLSHGSASSFSASLLTDTLGEFSAEYTLSLSDEDLPGEQQQSLTLQLVGEVVGGLAGDFNGNGTVDAADFTVWRDGLGVTYSPEQYDDWVNNFGATIETGLSQTVPEPAAALLAVAVLGVLAGRRGRG
ncbi:Extracellular ribonuclease precursor [Pseudobythopirellula maris]|uniref:Extracellular ribonuclease n=1 Tax=Pseudobythopirellula maris TaxID=2527991 RepID=A0A5C5ZUP1_9BACT|nr:endonuclease [Pseudobythopirellula maris]TWT90717.1 Extracellular ribonuclease precursor [Pseudobythopirellula maris]